MPDTADVVVFEVASRRLAVPSDRVHELVRAVAVTRLPGAPAGVDGVIDRRGSLIPVFDLRPRLALAAAPVRPTEQFIICAVETIGLVAVRADRVLELRTVAVLASVPAGSSTDPLVGSLIQLPDGVVVLCDLAGVLDPADVQQLARALAALEGGP
ncbi:MAG: chemotaxis protein CheW [Kofleriaceae bacterium]